MAEPIETSSQQEEPTEPGMGRREYLSKAVDAMSAAQEVVMLERGTILQKLWQTMSALGSTQDEQEAFQLDQQVEFLLTMAGQYTITLRVLETIGGAALQGLAQTGIQMPPAPTLIVPEDGPGQIIDLAGRDLTARKPRKKKG